MPLSFYRKMYKVGIKMVHIAHLEILTIGLLFSSKHPYSCSFSYNTAWAYFLVILLGRRWLRKEESPWENVQIVGSKQGKEDFSLQISLTLLQNSTSYFCSACDAGNGFGSMRWTFGVYILLYSKYVTRTRRLGETLIIIRRRYGNMCYLI